VTQVERDEAKQVADSVFVAVAQLTGRRSADYLFGVGLRPALAAIIWLLQPARSISSPVSWRNELSFPA
jgi:hypothetical protein